MKKVITYGTFDMLHHGHINLLKNAKNLGDYLIVGVTSEAYDQYRGKLNIQQSLLERIEAVKATGLVDEIVVEEYEGQKIDDITRLNVQIFAIGSDWTGKFDYLKEYCHVVYLERTKGISSTEKRDQLHPFIRLGVIGSGRIANRFITESKYVSGAVVEGVHGIHLNSAKEFADRHQLSFYTTQYSEMLKQVNAVYIASPHETHYAYAKQALSEGIHVLCEKPLAFSKQEAAELYQLAVKNNAILCEAIKTAYCPGFQRMVSIAKSGKIGKIVNVEATFTKLAAPTSREMAPTPSGGSVPELITYPLLAIFKLLGCNYQSLHFTSYHARLDQVDLFTKADLRYQGAMASAKVGLGVKGEGNLVVYGTRGYVYVPAPWWKTDYFELRFENLQDTEKNFYKFSGDGLRYELVSFLNQITEKEIDKANQEISIAIAGAIEQFMSKEAITIV